MWIEVEWTESIKRKARIQVPSEQIALDGAANGNLVGWLHSDLNSGAAIEFVPEAGEPVFHLIARVENNGRVVPL